MPETINVALLLLSLIFIILYPRWKRNDRLPPGPPRLPLIGNISQMNKDKPWHLFHQWSKEYVYLNLAGQPVIILNTSKAATDLLDRRSTNYRDRPRKIVMSRYLTRGLNFGSESYGELYI